MKQIKLMQGDNILSLKKLPENSIDSIVTDPTLKPINLMTYLCRLITPPGGIVLDTFMGSGSTGISACLEGFRFVGMELQEDYFKIAEARINNFEEYRKLLK
jgi:site-specific DNA-methyltransferase (adenine-specific)